MKESYYFSHDYNAHNDSKIEDMRFEMGWEGYGIYWALVEKLAQESSHKLSTNYKRIAFAMQTHEERIKMVVENFELFEIQEGFFFSNRLMSHFAEREEKRKKAQDSAMQRWQKKAEKDANASESHCESYAIKERKGKERKGKTDTLVAMQPNEYSESISFLKKQTLDNIDIPEYAENFKNDWIAFIAYWTEKGKTGKIRAEREPTFEIKRRFATWINRKKENYQKTQKPKRGVF